MSRSAKPVPSGRVEQFGGLREFDQDVGLRRSAPASVAAFLGDGLVECGHPAARTLQLSAQRLERGAVVFLQRRKPLQHFGRERRAGIGRRFLDQAVQRIGNVLGRVDGLGDQVLGVSISLSCSSLIARPPRRGARGRAACR